MEIDLMFMNHPRVSVLKQYMKSVRLDIVFQREQK